MRDVSVFTLLNIDMKLEIQELCQNHQKGGIVCFNSFNHRQTWFSIIPLNQMFYAL